MADNFSNPENLPVIYVTGFGPFQGHRINASEKVVKALTTFDIENELKVKLVTEVLEVSYGAVMKHVPTKWKSIKPKLVIHLGVSHEAKDIVLEKQSFNDGYVQADVNHCFLLTDKCIPDFPQVICTQLNLDKAVAELEKDCVDHLQCSLSTDPGRYLCGFTYYLSLSIDKSRCVFIHVPFLRVINTNPKEAAKRMAHTVYEIIKKLYQQVLEIENEATTCQNNLMIEYKGTSWQNNLKIEEEGTARQDNSKIENEGDPSQSKLELTNEATPTQSSLEVENDSTNCQSNIKLGNETTPCQDGTEIENKDTSCQNGLELKDATPSQSNLEIEKKATLCPNTLEIVNEATPTLEIVNEATPTLEIVNEETPTLEIVNEATPCEKRIKC